MSLPIIRVQNLNKVVPDSLGDLVILKGIDFELQAKETVAIVGASGRVKAPCSPSWRD